MDDILIGIKCIVEKAYEVLKDIIKKILTFVEKNKHILVRESNIYKYNKKLEKRNILFKEKRKSGNHKYSIKRRVII